MPSPVLGDRNSSPFSKGISSSFRKAEEVALVPMIQNQYLWEDPGTECLATEAQNISWFFCSSSLWNGYRLEDSACYRKAVIGSLRTASKTRYFLILILITKDSRPVDQKISCTQDDQDICFCKASRHTKVYFYFQKWKSGVKLQAMSLWMYTVGGKYPKLAPYAPEVTVGKETL